MKMKMKEAFLFLRYYFGRNALRSWQRSWLLICFACGILLFPVSPWTAYSGTAEETKTNPHGSLAEVGAKLSNPVSNVWALFTEFDLFFSNGDSNQGDAEVGGRMIFRPIIPIPLVGQGESEWKLISRPSIPIMFSQPVPKRNYFNEFNHLGGLGDSLLPMIISPPLGNWLLGLGPTWLLPTATQDDLGQQQWGVGPAFVIGYRNKDFIAGIFPQYTWGFAGWNDVDTPTASNLNMIYFFVYNLPDAYQIGLNPTITYDHNASSGNKWNVPVGLFVAKTTRMGNTPVKFQLGVEVSVVSQDDFGQIAQIKLNIIPVIPSLVKKALFGE